MEDNLVKQHVLCAEKTAVFSNEEIVTLKEILEDTTNHYKVISQMDGEYLKGFVIFGRTPFTEFGWDLYWIVVSPDFQRQGIGKALVAQAEQVMLSVTKGKAVIRIETSSCAEYAGARHLYAACHYAKIGSIQNFYKKENDLLLFAKEL